MVFVYGRLETPGRIVDGHHISTSLILSKAAPYVVIIFSSFRVYPKFLAEKIEILSRLYVSPKWMLLECIKEDSKFISSPYLAASTIPLASLDMDK
jgi:hypothetical protein